MSDFPLDPAYAALALEGAGDRDEVFDLLVRGARSRTRFAGVLVVHAGHLEGRRAAAAEPIRLDGFETLQLPRTVPAFEDAIASGQPSVTAIATGELFVDGLLDMLGGATQTALVAPVVVDGHVVALLIAHRSRSLFGMDDVEDLLPLIAAAGDALTRGRRARSRAATVGTEHRRATSSYDVEIIVHDGTEHRTTLVALRDREAWSELADALRDVVMTGIESGTPDEDEQLELLIELGHVEADRLRRTDRAVEAWRSALTIDSSDERVHTALHAVLVRHGRWQEVAELLEQRSALAELPALRIELMLELAAIGHERLADPERAIAAYERILNWEPEHPLASRELEALYIARGLFEPLAALLLDRASRDPDPRGRGEALEAVARLYEQDVGDLYAALLVWMTIARTANPAALAQVERLGPGVGAWEEVIAETAALAEELGVAGAATASRAWSLVGRWARDHGAAGDEPVRAFERAIHIEIDPARRAELATALGELAESTGDPARAIAWYETALTDEPEATAPLAALHGLYRARGLWQSLAAILPRIAAVDPATAAERRAAVALHVELGRVLADRLGRHEEAIRAFQSALVLDPDHAPAFQGIARAAQATGQTEAMLDAAEAALGAITDRTERTQRLGELAAAWHDRGQFERAADLWRELVALEPTQIAAHERLAEVLDRHLDDVDGAIASYTAVLAANPGHPVALDGLARLHDRAGHVEPTLDALRQLLEQTTAAPRARADVYQRMASVYGNAGDVAAARLNLVQALALDLDNAAAHEGMARVHLRLGELVPAGEELVRAAQLSTARPDKLRRLIDAAWVFRHRLRDPARARDCLQQVLELDPEHRDAKQALVDLLAAGRRWETLWDHLVPEIERARREDLPAVERRDIFVRAARCAVELDELERAIELFDRASALAEPASLPVVLIERADALDRNRAFDAAAAAYRAILVDHAAALDPTQTLAVCRKLGEIHTALGKLAAARPWHLKVLELDPEHLGALADLADLHLAHNQIDEAIANLRSIAAIVVGVERVVYFEKIGDLYRDKVGNPARAMSAYLDALERDPGNRRVLQRVLDLQSETGQWRAAVGTIAKFLEHESDPLKRGAYYLAEAEIRRTELVDKPGALDAYNSALDELFGVEPVDPVTRKRGLMTFRLVDELLTADRDWPRLEQAYLRMIQRVPNDPRVLLALWQALAEIYTSRLDRPEHAARAEEVVRSIERGGPAPVRAEETAVDPRVVLHTVVESGNVDEAWCAARALVVTKQATDDERAVYERFRAREGDKATGVLDGASWSLVRHPAEDVVVSAIFGLVWQGPVALVAAPAKDFELRPKDRMPIEDGTRVIAKIFRHAARVLDTALPEVYVQPRRPGRLLLANCIERGRLLPAVIVGRDLMTGYRDTEIAHVVGAMLALLRPTYYLRLTLNSEELTAAFAAAARLGGRADLVPALPRTAVFVTEIEKRLTPAAKGQLAGLVGRMTAPPDLARWRDAVEMTAQRAGLLVCGELAAALRMLSTGASAARPALRVRDLIAYSISPPYFAARNQLGVTVS